jgi:hypothetical protein
MAKTQTSVSSLLNEHRRAVWLEAYFAGAASAFLVSLLTLGAACWHF